VWTGDRFANPAERSAISADRVPPPLGEPAGGLCAGSRWSCCGPGRRVAASRVQGSRLSEQSRGYLNIYMNKRCSL